MSLDISSEFLGEYHTPISVKIDNDEKRSPGWKYNEYELKGVPLRIAIGARDMEKGQVELYRRDTQEKQFVSIENLAKVVGELLSDMQSTIYKKHATFTSDNTYKVDSYDEFKQKIEGGFVLAHWDGTTDTALQIQEETKATIRCIPFDSEQEQGIDMITGKPSSRRVLFAKAY